MRDLSNAGLSGRLLAAAAVILLSGCATTPGGALAPDPLEPLNRVTAAMNQVMDDVVVRPVTKAYVKVTPQPVQVVVHNFFSNLGEPIVIVNDLLQGKFRQSGADAGRFLVNSTFGIVGLFDVATPMGLEHHDEDLGQTLAVWGVPSGPYLVLPVLGPSTFRAGIGRYADSTYNPLSPFEIEDVSTRNASVTLEGLDTRSQLLDLQQQLKSAYDPYVFIRDAWLQHRAYLIYDGNPPPPEYPELPDLESDE
ncbi:MAG TPA: VacJ family lipoprotein [Gammaproteobacteria bacterium]|nr:VacJ family lipoprotein [Gammaproteobacteria bacterium]